MVEKETILHDDLIKFIQNGKFGIKSETGKIIINPVYEEIGSFRNRLIGFRERKYFQLPVYYAYRINLNARCTGNDSTMVYFDVAGVRCRMSKNYLDKGSHAPSEFMIGNTYPLTISNITGKNIDLIIMDQRGLTKKIVDEERDTDFNLGEIVQAIVRKVLYEKRIIITLPGNKKSYITKGQLAGLLPDIGMILQIQKIGFDAERQHTIWKLI